MPLHTTLTGQTHTTDGDSRVFSHSIDGRARAEQFTGRGPEENRTNTEKFG